MEKLHTSILVNASKEKVWHTMLDDATYREWTKAFHEGSYFEGSWEEGSTIRFLGPDPETGKEGGMLTRVKESRPYEFMSLEHIGIIKDGVEDTESEEARKWTPSYENYTFTEKDGGTEVAVDMQVDEEHLAMFTEIWDKALVELKRLAESN